MLNLLHAVSPKKKKVFLKIFLSVDVSAPLTCPHIHGAPSQVAGPKVREKVEVQIGARGADDLICFDAVKSDTGSATLQKVDVRSAAVFRARAVRRAKAKTGEAQTPGQLSMLLFVVCRVSQHGAVEKDKPDGAVTSPSCRGLPRIPSVALSPSSIPTHTPLIRQPGVSTDPRLSTHHRAHVETSVRRIPIPLGPPTRAGIPPPSFHFSSEPCLPSSFPPFLSHSQTSRSAKQRPAQ